MSNEDQKLTPEIEELLAEAAVFGIESLSSEERAQLALCSTEVSEFEMIAAEVLQQDNSFVSDMPADVLKRLVESVERETDLNVLTGTESSTELPRFAQTSLTPTGKRSWVPWLAAAACLLIGITIGRFGSTTTAPTISERMQQLLLQQGTVVAEWEAQADPAGDGVTGRVVWNEKLDEGYMTFIGLSPNDPQVEQYQLWVFDDARNAEIPVDGGVFDIAESTGEVVLPIRQNLSITKASLFAITVEKAGGVMKSDRSRLPLLAKIE